MINGSRNAEGISEWNQLSPLVRDVTWCEWTVGEGLSGEGEEEEVARSVQFSVGCVPEMMPRSRSRMWPLLHVLVLAAGLSCGDAQDGESLATSFLSGKPTPPF